MKPKQSPRFIKLKSQQLKRWIHVSSIIPKDIWSLSYPLDIFTTSTLMLMLTMLKIWCKSKILLHVQNIQSFLNGQFYLFQKSFFLIKCAPFLFKIEDDLNIDDYEGKKKLELVEFIFITHLNAFGSNVFLALKIMNLRM